MPRGSEKARRHGRPRANTDPTANGESTARGGTSSLEDILRRRGVDEAWHALEEMQRLGQTSDKFAVSRILMKTVGDGRVKVSSSKIYRGISLVERFIEMQPADVDAVLFNALLDTCCRLKDLDRLESTARRMRELNVQASPVTLGILVKAYGQAGDLQMVLKVWEDMHIQREQANAVTYGCMIDACVKCGSLAKSVEIFEGMRVTGKHRNTILYTTLIKGYGLEKDLEKAIELFREMPKEGVPYNTITYNSIIDACVKCGALSQAEEILKELSGPDCDLEPDLITYSTLLKGYCHIGDLERALRVAEVIKARGLRCDELVYNTLGDGCVKANDVCAGVGLFEEMIANGLRPSAITHSILVRLYERAGYKDNASEAVALLYQHHGLELPVGERRGARRMKDRNTFETHREDTTDYTTTCELPTHIPMQQYCNPGMGVQPGAFSPVAAGGMWAHMGQTSPMPMCSMGMSSPTMAMSPPAQMMRGPMFFPNPSEGWAAPPLEGWQQPPQAWAHMQWAPLGA